MKISAVIITYNEERNIGRCLESLAGIADEVVVLDSYSTDNTKTICEQYGAKFFQRPFDGYRRQKNAAMELAKNDWILSLDADEALSPELRVSIKNLPDIPAFQGYFMNRLTNYCGKWVRHTGWYPDRKMRLVHREKAQWGGAELHEKMELASGEKAGFLKGDLLHYSYYTVEEHYQRARKYAGMSARIMREKGKKGAWWRVIVSPLAKFIRNFIVKRGFLDGRTGSYH